MQKIVTLVLCLFFGMNLSAKKEIKYPISDIPAELKENAKAVVRLDKEEFTLVSDSYAESKLTFAITILNKNGLRYANFSESYSKLFGISNISATVYDANGMKLHRIKQEDILDVKATSGPSIYDDNRARVFEPKTKTLPFTIEYSYVRQYKGVFHFPAFSPFSGYNISVQKAEFAVRAKNLEDIKIVEKNIAVSSVNAKEDKYSVKKWNFENIKSYRNEAWDTSVSDFIPMIYLSPRKINIKGFYGTNEDWTDFGAFVYNLVSNRDELPEATVAEVKALVKDLKTDREKIKVLYEYMQKKTRYISIQVGMGGWQPFKAEVVDRLGYGDCKALSNYMKALLNVVDIPSIYTLVGAGRQPRQFNKEFSSNQFNHAILCVPQPKDTIWLECTSQITPCGFIGDFTDDREVLLITKEGGKLAHTKAYSSNDNNKTSTADITVKATGDADVKVNTRYSNQFYDDVYGILTLDVADQQKAIENIIGMSSFKLNSFTFDEHKSASPYIDEELNISQYNCFTKMGSRVILPLNSLRHVSVPPFSRNRKSDVLVRRPKTYHDTLTFHLPKGMVVDRLPGAKTIETKYGKYTATITKQDDSTIKYNRYFQLFKGQYPPEEYRAFREFLQNVNEADECKALLKQL